jgi:hypothetical protein
MLETLVAYLTGCGMRLYALAAIKSAARGGGVPWFLLWELLPLAPLLGFLLAVLLASGPATRLSKGYGFLYLAVALIAGCAVVYAQRRRRALAKAPGATIRSARQGHVEIRGEARPLPGAMSVRTPVGGEVALWYQFTCSKRRGLSEPWYTDRSETSDAAFLVDDGSGQCIVLPAGLASGGAHEWRSKGALEERMERWIAPGDRVFVSGELRVVRSQELPAALRAHLPKDEALRVLAAPADGRAFLIGNKIEHGEQLFYRAASKVNLVFLLLAAALGVLVLRYGQGG